MVCLVVLVVAATMIAPTQPTIVLSVVIDVVDVWCVGVVVLATPVAVPYGSLEPGGQKRKKNGSLSQRYGSLEPDGQKRQQLLPNWQLLMSMGETHPQDTQQLKTIDF